MVYSLLSAMRSFFFDWQTLIAGLLALIGAWVTVRALQKQAREDAERKALAARVMLPNALAALVDYSIECVRWLDSIRDKAAVAETGAYKSAILVPTCPRPDPGMISTLRDSVEFLGIEHARFIGSLVSELQVQSAWVTGLHDYFTNFQLYESKRVGLTKNIDEAAVKSIHLVAGANALFPFARSETEDRPKSLTFGAAETAFKNCNLTEHKNTSVWNMLTDPFLEKERKRRGIEPLRFNEGN